MPMFTATDDQVAQLIQNAINASLPAGLGFLHFDPDGVTREECAQLVRKSGDRVDLDYVGGRMVKLGLRRLGPEQWKADVENPREDYQSWARTYPTVGDLLRSAGLQEIKTAA